MLDLLTELVRNPVKRGDDATSAPSARVDERLAATTLLILLSLVRPHHRVHHHRRLILEVDSA